MTAAGLACLAWVVGLGGCHERGPDRDAGPSTLDHGCFIYCCAGATADPACVDACEVAPPLACVELLTQLGECEIRSTCCDLECPDNLAAVRDCMDGPSERDAGTGGMDGGLVPGCEFRSPEVPVVCSNSLDDDCDGLVDCDDPDCAPTPRCGGTTPPDGGVTGPACPDEPTLVDVQTFPGTGGLSVVAGVLTASDELVLVGGLSGMVDFGSGPIDAAGVDGVYVVRLDAARTARWTRHFVATEDIEVRAMALDESGNTYFGGAARGTVDFGLGPIPPHADTRESFAVKLDPAGNTLWAQRYRIGEVEALAVAPGGVLWMTGGASTAGSNGPASFGVGGPELMGPGGADIFVAALDLDGNHRASRLLGGPDPDAAFDIDVDPSGNVALTVRGADGADFGAGVVSSPGDSGDDHLLMLTPTGDTAWALRVDGLSGPDVRFAPDGAGIVLRGGNVAWLDPTGHELWRVDATAGFDRDLAFDAAMSLWLFATAESAGTTCALSETQDILFARVTGASCQPVRSRSFARAADDVVQRRVLELAPDGTLVVAGSFSGTGVDLGNGAMTAASSTVFVARFRP